MSNQKLQLTVANLLALIGARHTDTLLGAYAGLCLPSLTSKTKGQLERALDAETPANKQRHKTRLPRSDRFDDFCVACDNAANIIGAQLDAQFARLVNDGKLPQATQDRVYHAIQIMAAQLRSLPETLGDELV